MTSLFDTLTASGQEPIILDGRLLVLPHGARVLGLAPDGHTNLTWTNPALSTADSAKALLADTGWGNLGGDRTWISPELDTHIQDPNDWSNGYTVPKRVDPAAYRVISQDDRSVSLESNMLVHFRRSQANVRLTVRKTIELLDTPPLALPSGADCVGYRQTCRLTIDPTPGCDARPAVWQILQVPGGGSIHVPVRPGARPRAFIGDPVYELDGSRLRCDVRTAASFKFSLVADDCCGKMLYQGQAKGRDTLLLRTFPVLPTDRYADVSATDPDDLGHVQQFYVDDGALGGFGELEYHGPAIDATAGGSVEESSDVWACIGDNLDDIAEEL